MLLDQLARLLRIAYWNFSRKSNAIQQVNETPDCNKVVCFSCIKINVVMVIFFLWEERCFQLVETATSLGSWFKITTADSKEI